MIRFAIQAGVLSATCLAVSAATLQNDALAIHFSSPGSGFAVTSVVNRLCGDTRFLETDMKSPDLWEICLAADGGADPKRMVRLNNHAPSSRRTVEELKDGLAFAWKGLSIPGGEGECVDVRAEVRLPGGCAASEWTISVDCRSDKWALWEVRYPCLKGVVKSGEADVLMPYKGFGARLHKAYDTAKGEIGVIGYPGWFPMVCAYMKGEAGLYFAAHDPDGRAKALAFERGAAVSFKTLVENAGVVGKAAEGPGYSVTLAAFKGDWWQAARLYRQWAIRQKWCAKGRMCERSDYPRAMADVDLWLLASGSLVSVTNATARGRAALKGLDIGVHWYNWNNEPFDTHYPEFLPLRGFKESCGWMASEGIVAMPYINGRIWDQSLASAPYAWQDACMAPDGGVQKENYNKRTFAVMCPYTAGWGRTLTYNITNVVFGSGTGAIYCDQISCSRPQPCFNAAHGHPLGGGSWWDEGYRRMLAPVHGKLAAENIPITSEGMAENWMDVVDGHLNCSDPETEDVPFYPAVYSGYTTYFGARLMPWDTSEALFAVEARALLWGVTPGWTGVWTFGKGREKWADVLLKAGRIRHATRDFLAYGTLLDELRMEERQPEISFEKKQRNRNKRDEFIVSTFSIPRVFGTVWKDVSGRRTAVFAANISETVQTVRFRLPQGVSALSPLSGDQPAKMSVSGGVAELSISPRQIVVLAE